MSRTVPAPAPYGLPEPCRLWQGALLGGYAEVTHGRRNWVATRLIVLERDGELPPAVMHRCDVRRCIEPTHLVAGDHRQNHADAMAKGRKRFGEHGGFLPLPSHLAIRTK